ncbi:MAG: hypothetical protein Q4E53_10395 [Eubacteriales bacterium]|nr:hypothetical protein [Eubacteriales bacterium]
MRTNVRESLTAFGKKYSPFHAPDEQNWKSIQNGLLAIIFCMLLLMIFRCPVFAADKTGTGAITNAFNSIYQIIAAIVSSIGQLYLLWGVFEWATALNGNDGTAQSMAFKRISAGLVACLAPQIITLINI